MPPVYQSKQGPNLLAWADRTTPRTGEMTIAGEEAGMKMQALMQEIAHAQAMYPIELNMAKMQSDLAAINLEREKLLNSTERIEEMAALQSEMDRLKTDQVKQERRKLQAMNSFEASYGDDLVKAKLAGNVTAFSDLVSRISDDMGDDFKFVWKDVDAMIGQFDERRRDMIRDQIASYQLKRQLKIDELAQESAAQRMRVDAARAKIEDMDSIAAQLLGMPPSDIQIDEQDPNFSNFKVGMTKALSTITKEMEGRGFGDTPHGRMLRELSKMIGKIDDKMQRTKAAGRFPDGEVGKFSVVGGGYQPDKPWFAWTKKKQRAVDEAQWVFSDLTMMAEAIASEDENVREAGMTGLVRILNALRKHTDGWKRYKEESQKVKMGNRIIKAINTQIMGLRGATTEEPSRQLPAEDPGAYSSEAEARYFGHGAGETVRFIDQLGNITYGKLTD